MAKRIVAYLLGAASTGCFWIYFTWPTCPGNNGGPTINPTICLPSIVIFFLLWHGGEWIYDHWNDEEK